MRSPIIFDSVKKESPLELIGEPVGLFLEAINIMARMHGNFLEVAKQHQNL